MSIDKLKAEIFEIIDNNSPEFEQIALEVFRFQAANVPIYAQYLLNLNVNPTKVSRLVDVPFLPVELFKSQEIIAAGKQPEVVFMSSGTTGMVRSNHFVADAELYRTSFLKGFKRFYGEPFSFCILALLPSYLERDGSSLVYMMDELIQQSNHPDSGFYLHNIAEMAQKLRDLDGSGQKVMLVGVTFALLDLVEEFEFNLKNTIVMETGGMKGKRREIPRPELHATLCQRMGVKSIHSEYGMTELLSQGYSFGDGIFSTPPWMKILIRDTNDPFAYTHVGQTGGINVVDLANLYSCSFLELKDLGKTYSDGQFEVLGRFDNSDIRGCNLLVAE